MNNIIGINFTIIVFYLMNNEIIDSQSESILAVNRAALCAHNNRRLLCFGVDADIVILIDIVYKSWVSQNKKSYGFGTTQFHFWFIFFL